MEMTMHVAKWGNSLAVRLPAALVKELDLREGDEIEIAATGPGRLTLAHDRRMEEAIERIRALRVPFPADYKFDRDEANAR